MWGENFVVWLWKAQLFPVSSPLNQRGRLKVACSAVIGHSFCLDCVPSWWPARVIRHSASVTQKDYVTLCIVCVCVSLSANQSDRVRSSFWQAQCVPMGVKFREQQMCDTVIVLSVSTHPPVSSPSTPVCQSEQVWRGSGFCKDIRWAGRGMEKSAPHVTAQWWRCLAFWWRLASSCGGRLLLMMSKHVGVTRSCERQTEDWTGEGREAKSCEQGMRNFPSLWHPQLSFYHFSTKRVVFGLLRLISCLSFHMPAAMLTSEASSELAGKMWLCTLPRLKWRYMLFSCSRGSLVAKNGLL